MLYPTDALTFIQTDNILTLTVNGSTHTVTMNDAAVTTFTVSAAQYADIVSCVNENHA